ncbi:MAG: DNA mismatch repair endonuclease MutL [Planctomycetota bacterium]
MAEPATTAPDARRSAEARRPIRRLDPVVASQIAAGEVIERPASVVKELVENALDAGATRVRVELEQGGTELIRVTDDGSGIPETELPLAVTAHATSKIETTADLDRIATMGFRGEALASIASVARVEIRSRARAAAAGAELAIAGDVADLRARADESGPRYTIAPASGPVGTRITVRNLFFATPARRKFLKTPQTERGRCLDALRDLALAHPAIGFALVSEGRQTLDLPPDQTLRARALAVLGPELEPQLIEVHADEHAGDHEGGRGLTLWGLVGTPAIARATASHQRLFVNGRAVRDRAIQHALKEAFRGLMDPSRHPTAALVIEMTPEAVDVNVHPAKAEVRFRDSGFVHSVVRAAVKRALLDADLTPTALGPLPPPESPSAPGPAASARDWSPLPGTGRAPSSLGSAPGFFDRPVPAPGRRLDFASLQSALQPDPLPNDVPPSGTVHGGSAHDALGPEERVLRPDPLAGVLQVHDAYLLAEDDQGVVIIDQHALHERVMFEMISARLASGNLETQRLLVPETLDVAESQLERLSQLAPLLERIGVEAEPIAPAGPGRTPVVAIHAFPSFLFEKRVDPAGFLRDLIDLAEARGLVPSQEEALREVVDMMSCKAAVKAGDRLTPPELARLLELREEVERSSSCPHGRPTSIRLTLTDLEKLFHRR